MDIVGIDISKAKFDAALLVGARIRHAVFSNTEAGFEQLLAWLARHRPDQPTPMHACMVSVAPAFWFSRALRAVVASSFRGWMGT